MNEPADIEQFLDQLGLKHANIRAAAKADIYTYALEAAVAILLERGALTVPAQKQLKKIFAAGDLKDPRLTQAFNTPERKEVLREALTEAMEVAATAVGQ